MSDLIISGRGTTHIIAFIQIEFVDIAGIVKGASEGAGLGNKFLNNIRMTDAIVHVVRCFVDDDIIHVDGNVDPLRDVEIISLELILADLAQIEKKLEKVTKEGKKGEVIHFTSPGASQFLTPTLRPTAG